MSFKERDKFIEMERLKALFRRTPEKHMAKVLLEKDLKIKQSEITGEKNVDYPLGFLDKDKYLIMHNIRLEDANGFFQMDSLVLSEYFLL